MPLSDINKEWTFEHMYCFSEYLKMENDYKSAWRAYFDEKAQKEAEVLANGR